MPEIEINIRHERAADSGVELVFRLGMLPLQRTVGVARTNNAEFGSSGFLQK
jgi:hypothetical protein